MDRIKSFLESNQIEGFLKDIQSDLGNSKVEESLLQNINSLTHSRLRST